MADAQQPAMDANAYGNGNISGVPTHGGRFMRYNIFDNTFEVTAKYVPPLFPVGRGAYGIVCSALNSQTNEQVAIKKIANAFDNQIDAKRTLREIRLLQHLQHENIVAIRDVIPPPQREGFDDVYIGYELMDTDLHQIIRSNQALSDNHCQYFLYQLLRGLKYIHSANVLHRDLKPSNILVDANCDLKIGDFGLARITSETDFMTEYVVTRWYRAPELLLNSTDYTAAIDVWSVGCIFMELMNRQPLFPGRDNGHQLRILTELIGTPTEDDLNFIRSDGARRFIRGLTQYPRQSFAERFPHIHPSAIDLCERMLTFDPARRITVDFVITTTTRLLQTAMELLQAATELLQATTRPLQTATELLQAATDCYGPATGCYRLLCRVRRLLRRVRRLLLSCYSGREWVCPGSG